MSLTMRMLLVFLCCFGGLVCGLSPRLLAQHYAESEQRRAEEEGWWQELLERWQDKNGEEEEEWQEYGHRFRPHHEWVEQLQQLREEPLNLNTATREELSVFPFLSTEQIDSLLAYRQRIRAFFSLGDLMAVPRWGYRERRWLSLFVHVGDTLAPPRPWYAPLTEGRHQLVWQGQQALYRRVGFLAQDAEGRSVSRRLRYLGQSLASSLRYRQQWRGRVQWGVTLQNDSGEPFAQRGNLPFDYQSLYVAFRPPRGDRQWFLGDYKVQWGQGLLMGSGLFRSPLQQLTTSQNRLSRLRPHTSSDEVHFFRGVAFQKAWRYTALSLLFSHRKHDGLVQDDTLRSWKRDGLHRNLQELHRRHSLGVTTLAARWEWLTASGQVGGNVYAEHYAHWVPLLPRYAQVPIPYARWAGGGSVDYAWRNKHWTLQGEGASDGRGHLATTHTLRWENSSGLSLLGGTRWFSAAFFAPHAQTMSQSVHVQNERALTLGLLHPWCWGLRVRAFADLFERHAPSFRADRASWGVDSRIEVEWGDAATHGQHQLRYRLRARRQNIPRHAPLQEWRSTQALRYQWWRSGAQLSWTLMAEVSAHRRQTRSAPSWGMLLASRASWQIRSGLHLACFAALFRTDDYDTRIYAYQPQLYAMGAFPQFAHRGLSGVCQGTWHCLPPCWIGLRVSVLHDFDRKSMGSGTQRIDGSTLTDLSGFVRWQF